MKRKLLSNLLKWKALPLRNPLILKGVRQVGKTYLLKEFGEGYFKKSHYINFEQDSKLANIFQSDLDPDRILLELSFYLDSSIEVGEDLIIFDEVQECPKALTSLKYFQEKYPQLHLCCAGSVLGVHLNSTSFPVGKVTFEILRPMSFWEFLMANNDKSLPFLENFLKNKTIPEMIHNHLWEQMKIYLVVGGLPDAVKEYVSHQKDPYIAFEAVRKKQKDLLFSYYADIAKHSGKVNAMHIDRILQSIPNQLQQKQDGSSSRFKFKGVVPGISHYDRLSGAIDWLESAGLIIKVPISNSGLLPFKAYSKENLFKLFLFDVGLLGCLSNLSAKNILDYDYGSYKGFFVENFVCQEFLSFKDDPIFSWAENNYEVEFLKEMSGFVVPIEVKSGKNLNTISLKKFINKYNCRKAIVLSGNSLQIDTSQIQYYPLYLAGFGFPTLMEIV